MRACDCELLPDPPDAGRLWVAAPLGHTQARLGSFLRERGLVPDESLAGLIAVVLPPGRLRQLGVELVGTFTAPELGGSRCLLLPPGERPAP